MIRIIIAEDLQEIREGLVQVLTRQDDFVVVAAFSNGQEAMPGIIESQPDIVIMDINMPGISGIDCIRQIRDECPDTQFMIFTIYENDEKIVDALAAGASGYLLKKTPPEKMIEAIIELHHGGSPMSSQIARKVIGFFKQAKPEDNIQLTKKWCRGRESNTPRLPFQGSALPLSYLGTKK